MFFCDAGDDEEEGDDDDGGDGDDGEDGDDDGCHQLDGAFLWFESKMVLCTFEEEWLLTRFAPTVDYDLQMMIVLTSTFFRLKVKWCFASDAKIDFWPVTRFCTHCQFHMVCYLVMLSIIVIENLRNCW